MKNTDIIQLTKRFTQASGLSGFEHPIRDEITAVWTPLVDEIRTDTLGNLIAIKKATNSINGKKRSTIMLASHMDEIGMIVTRIRGSFLSIANLSGIDMRYLLGQPVWVHGRETLPGVVGSRPPHLLTEDDREKLVPLEKMVVDVGLSADKVESLVSVGDTISFRQETRQLLGDRITGKALDNRISIVALTICLEILQTRAHQWDVAAVATVQEEGTMAGIITGAYGINPDVGLAMDVTFADGPGVSSHEVMALNKGPTIGIGPSNHPGIHRTLVETAKSVELLYQIEPNPTGTGTDAWAMEVVRAGIPTGLIGIPIRNMHMPVEIADVRDIDRAGRLVAEFITRLDDTFIAEQLAWD
ncbi:MAG: M20/M25/M40 family metallo-hydrolase [Anaerolineales bacterium]|nr:M20/M25/M40 family metallo-hydrolase [Anaerolineales bacterium]